MLLAPLRSAAYIIRPPRTLEGAVPDELRSAHRAARRPAPQGQLPLGSRDRHRGRRGGHGAHGGEEPDRVRLPYPRGAGARGRRRARRRPAARGSGQELASRRPVVSRRAAVPERGGDRLSVEERLERYVTELFAPEDPVLSAIRARHDALKLPPIHISPDEGKLLYVLLRAVAAARVLELGSLAGYSGVWLARALTARGTLTTIEIDARHAALARQAYAEAGVAERVQLIEGAALDVLPTLAPGFDAVFVDADKAPLAQYFEWSVRLLRPGGLLLCDNAFFHGAVVDPGDHSAEAEGVRAFNRLAASDPRVVAAVAPIRDGLVIGVKLLS